MSASRCLDAELSAVMDSLLLAAVEGLQRVTETGEPLTMFPSVMETLCNEALGKILSILEPVKVQLKLDKLSNPSSTKPHVLYILQDSRVGVEHSYGAIQQDRREEAAHCFEENDEKTDKGLSDQRDDQIETEETAELITTTSSQEKWSDIILEPFADDEMECSDMATCGETNPSARDNLSHKTEEFDQNEDGSEEDQTLSEPTISIFRVKRENEDSSSERAEEMCDSSAFSSASCVSDLKPTASTPKIQFNCGICEIGYSSESAFRKHMCTHTGGKPFKCSSCDSSYYQAASLKRHMYKHSGEQPFKCPECGKGFSDKEKLKGHMSVHTGHKAFPCNVCGKSFTAKTNLCRHMRLHSGDRPYTCSECGRSYTRPESLKVHMVVHSSGMAPLNHTFKCSFCDRAFSQKANLTVHERIHTGERPYVCSLCSKAFRTSVSLKVHLRVHTGEKPYICDVCGRPFSQQSSLLVHRRVHLNERNYVCPTCNKSFNNPQNLKVHLRVHTGERPFVCGLCGKTFVQDAHLRMHKQHMHAGVKQCVCEHCGKAYADRRNLRLHKCVYK